MKNPRLGRGLFIKNHRRTHFAASPFPKKGTLLACRRFCDASAFCQPFSGTNSPSENAEISFLCAFHILLLFPQKRHACIAAGINAPAMAPLRCRFFACGEIQIWQGNSKGKSPETPWFRAFFIYLFFQMRMPFDFPQYLYLRSWDAHGRPASFFKWNFALPPFCRRFIGWKPHSGSFCHAKGRKYHVLRGTYAGLPRKHLRFFGQKQNPAAAEPAYCHI